MDSFAPVHELRRGHRANELPPTPLTPDGADLTLRIRCYTSRDTPDHTTHDLTLHADGTADLPHDLTAERVAVAFGGYSSCLELVEHGIPALRAVAPLLARRAHVPLVAGARGRWRIPRGYTARCCAAVGFADPGAALDHLRDPWHVRLAHGGCPEPILGPILVAIAARWATTATTATPSPAPRLVLEPDGVDELWRAGIHPDDLPALAAPAATVGRPLPVGYFLGMRYGTVDPAWFATVIAARPDESFASWLAQQQRPQERGDADQWSGWLGHGLATTDVDVVTGLGIPLGDVDAIGAATGWPTWLTARAIVRWAAAGCRLTPDHAVALARRGLEHHRPSANAIEGLISDLRLAGLGREPLTEEDRSELALLLALLGTRRSVVQAVGAGVRTVAGLRALTG